MSVSVFQMIVRYLLFEYIIWEESLDSLDDDEIGEAQR